jgi:hypothetical protein
MWMVLVWFALLAIAGLWYPRHPFYLVKYRNNDVRAAHVASWTGRA